MATRWSLMLILAFWACKETPSERPTPKSSEPPTSKPLISLPKNHPSSKPVVAGRLERSSASVFIRQTSTDVEQWNHRPELLSQASVFWRSMSTEVAGKRRILHLVGRDLELLRSFVASQELSKNAEVWFAKDVTINAPSQPIRGGSSSLIIRHEVQSFELWFKRIKGAAVPLRKAGVVGMTVSRDPKQERVAIIHIIAKESTAPEKLRAIVMREIAIEGEPTIWDISRRQCWSPLGDLRVRNECIERRRRSGLWRRQPERFV